MPRNGPILPLPFLIIVQTTIYGTYIVVKALGVSGYFGSK